jgi:hypothetical protein
MLATSTVLAFAVTQSTPHITADLVPEPVSSSTRYCGRMAIAWITARP